MRGCVLPAKTLPVTVSKNRPVCRSVIIPTRIHIRRLLMVNGAEGECILHRMDVR